jgi:hypothetical protein
LARWGGTVQTEAVPAHRPSIVKQLSPSNILDNDRAEVVRQTKAEAWTENAKAVHCRHLQLINSVEQVLGRILALYSPGRFAQLVAQLGSDEERQVLVTLRGLRRASRNKGE